MALPGRQISRFQPPGRPRRVQESRALHSGRELLFQLPGAIAAEFDGPRHVGLSVGADKLLQAQEAVEADSHPRRRLPALSAKHRQARGRGGHAGGAGAVAEGIKEQVAAGGAVRVFGGRQLGHQQQGVRSAAQPAPGLQESRLRLRRQIHHETRFR